MFRQIKEGQDNILDFFKDEIDKHKRNFDPTTKQPKDYIDACLMEMNRREKSGENMGHFR